MMMKPFLRIFGQDHHILLALLFFSFEGKKDQTDSALALFSLLWRPAAALSNQPRQRLVV